MRFRSHQCWFPKDVDFPRDYEDASARSEKHGRAVVADGVSSAIFSRNWARLLTRAAVETPPSLETDEAIRGWLEPLQQAWRQDIDFNSLKWHQKPKATSVGAQATLLIVHVEQSTDGTAAPGEYRLRASGLGDCVLYLIRQGRKILSFPLTTSAEFAQPPEIFSSIAKGVSYAEKFRHLDDRCQAGDLLVVCSDAVGLWAMEEYEAGRAVDWMRYWENDQAWQEDIQRLRDNKPADGNRMRVDDCTLVLLQVVAEESIDGEPEIQSDRSDQPFVLLGTEQVAASAIPGTESVAASDPPGTESVALAVVESGDEARQTERLSAPDRVPVAAPSGDAPASRDEATPTESTLPALRSEDVAVAYRQPEETGPAPEAGKTADHGSALEEDRARSSSLFGRLKQRLTRPRSAGHDPE